MSQYINKSHNVTALLYHLVFPAKYRRVVFDDDVEKVLKKVCFGIEECIPAADLSHIFERSWSKQAAGMTAQMDDAPKPQHRLGPGITRCILELHGSRIEVQSAPHTGTAFYFGLPAA